MREYILNDRGCYIDYLNKEGESNSERNKKIKSVLKEIMVDTCTKKQLQVVQLILDGKKQKEIASILNVDKSTVSKTYKRGLNNIRKRAKYLEMFL